MTPSKPLCRRSYRRLQDLLPRSLGHSLTHPLAHKPPTHPLTHLPQVRINGENPAKDFQPCPGSLGEVRFPMGERRDAKC